MAVPADAEVAFSSSTGSPVAVSRCAWRGGAGSYRRSAASYRRIDQNVLIFVFVDHGRIAINPPGRYPELSGGQFARIGPMTGVFSSIHPDPGQVCSIMSVIVPAHMLSPLLPAGSILDGPLSSERGHGLVARNAAATLCEAGDGLDSETIVRLCELLVGALAACAVEAAAPVGKERAIDRRYARLLDCVDRQFHRPEISAGAVAADMGISERYLSLVLASRGETFPQLLRKRRLSEARRLLRAPALAERSIADVAAMAGFADPAYFSRLFTSDVGATPRRYREENL